VKQYIELRTAAPKIYSESDMGKEDKWPGREGGTTITRQIQGRKSQDRKSNARKKTRPRAGRPGSGRKWLQSTKSRRPTANTCFERKQTIPDRLLGLFFTNK
jgi:hypothetical protein